MTTEATTLTKREFLFILALALAIAGAATAIALLPGKPRLSLATSGSSPDPPRQLIPFKLTERGGCSITQADLAGQFLVVNFVFTGCSLRCLEVNYRMEEIQRLVREQHDVRLVSLTIDPDSDTPQSLATFAQRFNADTNHWLFLTGEKSTLHRLIETSFLGPGKKELKGIVPGGFANTDQIALVDSSGEVQAMFNGLKPSAARDVIEALAKLREQMRLP